MPGLAAALCGWCGAGGGGGARGDPDAPGAAVAPDYTRLRALMAGTTLDQLKRPVQSVVILKDTATVDQALSILAKHRILSAPVVLGSGPATTAAADGNGAAAAPLGRAPSDEPVNPASAAAARAAAQWPQNKSTSRSSFDMGPGGSAGPASGGAPAASAAGSAPGGPAVAGQLLGFLDIRDVLASFLGELEDVKSNDSGDLSVKGANNNSGSSKKKMPDLRGMKMLAVMRVLEERGAAWSAATRIRDLSVFGGDGDFFAASQAGRATLRELIEYCLGSPGSSGVELHAAAPLAPASRSRAGGAASERTQAAGAASRAASSGDGDGAAGGANTTTPTPVPPAASGVVIHRVAVCDSRMRITNVVSQTDVVRFLYAHLAALGPLALKTARELGWASRAVVCATPELSAIEAMRLMHERHVSALAVVDSGPKKRIIGNFSVSELRTICAEHFGSLALPVAEFLALENHTEFVGYRQHEVPGDSAAAKWTKDRNARGCAVKKGAAGAAPAVAPSGGSSASAAAHQAAKAPGGEVGQALVLAMQDDTFSDIVGRFVKHGIHRIYVVDDDCVPVGVVTCSDILRAALYAANGGEAGVVAGDKGAAAAAVASK
jgi:CBS domain-containing protein